MPYTLKTNEDEVRRRHRAFWAGRSIEGPLVYATAKKPHSIPPWESKEPRKAWDLNPQWHQNRTASFLEGHVFLGDAMPEASLMVGLDITNNVVLAGGDYQYSSNGGQIYCWDNQFHMEQPIPGFTPEHPLAVALKQCYEEVIETVSTKGFVNTPMTLDPLSSIYMMDEVRLLKDLAKRPKLVEQRVSELTDCYLDFYDYFYRFLRDAGYGESASWYGVFCEGPFEGVRCDFATMFSNRMFQLFAVPMLERICGHMEKTLFNMSSVAHLRFSEILGAIPRLDGFFWNPEPYLNGIGDYLPQLKALKGLKPCLELVCYSVEDAQLAVKTLGSDGVYIYFPIPFETVSEAEAALRQVRQAAGLKE